MNSTTADELRQRIAGYERLRMMTRDAQALEAIDRIITENEARLLEIETVRPKPQGPGGSRD
jgi:hypothetical protein